MVADRIEPVKRVIEEERETEQRPVKVKAWQLQILADKVAPDEFHPSVIEHLVREIHLPDVIGNEEAVESGRVYQPNESDKQRKLNDESFVDFGCLVGSGRHAGSRDLSATHLSIAQKIYQIYELLLSRNLLHNRQIGVDLTPFARDQ